MRNKLLLLLSASVALSLAGYLYAAEEISVDVSDLESNPGIMKQFDVDRDAQLSDSELEAYITWLESGGDGTVKIVEGARWVFVKNGKPIRYWHPLPPRYRRLPPGKKVPPPVKAVPPRYRGRRPVRPPLP